MTGFNSKSNTSRCACVTIDFKKAFDTICWDAIKSIMELFGFDKNFCEMAMFCLCTMSFSHFIEGTPTEVFQAQREVRQGDPFSPLCNGCGVRHETCKKSGREQTIRIICEWWDYI